MQLPSACRHSCAGSRLRPQNPPHFHLQGVDDVEHRGMPERGRLADLHRFGHDIEHAMERVQHHLKPLHGCGSSGPPPAGADPAPVALLARVAHRARVPAERDQA